MRALVFPGQGSQSVGMLADLYDDHETVRRTFAEASAATGLDMAHVCFSGPAERLARTDVTQPALLTCSVAVYRLLADRGLRFDCALGHSLGEYSALVATGAVEFAVAADLVHRRGAAMQAAAGNEPGGMLAVLGLDDDTVEGICADIGGVWPANYNCPGQVVVSGTKAGLLDLERRAQEAGARKVVPLQVSGAFHTPLMVSAAQELGDALQRVSWSAPRPSFFSVSAVALEDGCSAAPDARVSFAELLCQQVTAPVRFTQSVRALSAAGYDAFLEVGPGAVLSGLVRRIVPEASVARVGDVATLAQLEASEWLERSPEVAGQAVTQEEAAAQSAARPERPRGGGTSL